MISLDDKQLMSGRGRLLHPPPPVSANFLVSVSVPRTRLASPPQDRGGRLQAKKGTRMCLEKVKKADKKIADHIFIEKVYKY